VELPHVDACFDELMFLFRRSAVLSRLRCAEAMFAACEWSDDSVEISNPDNLIQVSWSHPQPFSDRSTVINLTTKLDDWYISRCKIKRRHTELTISTLSLTVTVAFSDQQSTGLALYHAPQYVWGQEFHCRWSACVEQSDIVETLAMDYLSKN